MGRGGELIWGGACKSFVLGALVGLLRILALS